MRSQDLEALFRLLQTREIPGTEEQLQRLFIRLEELGGINGREWIERNRDCLLRQWAALVGQGRGP